MISTLATLSLALAVVVYLVCAVVLFVIDVREHRLPNRWTGALAGAGLILLGLHAVLAGGAAGAEGAAIGWACAQLVLGGVGYFMLMLVLHLASRGAIGMGDVKLAFGLGIYTAGLGAGLQTVALAAFLGFVLGGVIALALVLFTTATASTRFPFGPPMLVGASLAMLI